MASSPEKNQIYKKQIAQLKSELKKEKAEKALLLQQIELLKYEIEDYKRQDIETRKLNQTVISSYKNTDQARDQMLQSSLQDLNKKHKQEIQRMVVNHAKNINTLEAEVKSLKEKLETNNEIQQQARLEIERNARIKAEENHRKERQALESELKDSKNRVATLESKLRKAQQLVKTYREHMEKLDFEVEKNEVAKSSSMQYSFLSALQKKKQEDELLMSKLYKSKRDAEQSRMLKSHNNILHSIDLKTNEQRGVENENRTTRSNRRISTREFVEEVNQSARKSKKYLDVTRQSIENLTSRISKVVSSLQKRKGPPDRKMSEYMHERLERKLKLR